MPFHAAAAGRERLIETKNGAKAAAARDDGWGGWVLLVVCGCIEAAAIVFIERDRRMSKLLVSRGTAARGGFHQGVRVSISPM
ncbi:MAG: hypothetical protein HY649_06825 [Acidobacteria bacterium]|nr:hypothetical protein [Acidobacteriota bacterium]